MIELEEKIMTEGTVLPGNILKVDAFLNHQIDIELMDHIGRAFYERYKGTQITKILTIETSGIAPACFTAQKFGVPLIIAKKSISPNLGTELYTTIVHSYTHDCNYHVSMNKNYLSAEDHVLIVDDFMANGLATEGLIDICHQAGVTVEGLGICIEKGFQDGGKKLREKGVRVESLAFIRSMSDYAIAFRTQKEPFEEDAE